MATKLLAGMVAVQFVRLPSVPRINLSSLPLLCHPQNPSSACFSTSALATASAVAAGVRNRVAHLDGVRRWQVRSMSGDADSTEKQRMPARLAQKQQLLDAAPAYPDDADAPIPKVSIGIHVPSFPSLALALAIILDKE
jgi:hypothetical protein